MNERDLIKLAGKLESAGAELYGGMTYRLRSDDPKELKAKDILDLVRIIFRVVV